MECLNSYAAVFVDGKPVGEVTFPGGEVDLTPLCRPGGTHALSLFVVAMPLSEVLLSHSDTNADRQVKGRVARRGLCGDLFLVGTPDGACLADVKVDTSVRRREITFDAALLRLAADAPYALRARVSTDGEDVVELTSRTFKPGDLEKGRIAFTFSWRPDGLWDIHTPQLRRQSAQGGGHPEAFGPPAVSCITTLRAIWVRCTRRISIPISSPSRSCRTGSSIGRTRA